MVHLADLVGRVVYRLTPSEPKPGGRPLTGQASAFEAEFVSSHGRGDFDTAAFFHGVVRADVNGSGAMWADRCSGSTVPSAVPAALCRHSDPSAEVP